MKLKRKISILMLCLVIMGSLPSNVITAKAVHCTHPYFLVDHDVPKEEYHDEYFHYTILGTRYCCPCGYTYWENLTTDKKGHTWVHETQIIYGSVADITYCKECGLLQP